MQTPSSQVEVDKQAEVEVSLGDSPGIDDDVRLQPWRQPWHHQNEKITALATALASVSA
jgi:hypothetical protein